MRLLADENVPLESVRALRSAGHDGYSASEGVRGEPDERHLRGPTRPAAGVLLLRIVPKSALEVTALLVDLLARLGIEWGNHLSVVDRSHIRQRRI